MLIGVLSDTHGKLPAEVVEVFAGVERIIHAGDVGPGYVLEELETIAPVIAVRGNVDDPASSLPAVANVALGGTRVLVVHRPADVPRPLPEGIGVVVFGHTHVPLAEDCDGVLWLQPGLGLSSTLGARAQRRAPRDRRRDRLGAHRGAALTPPLAVRARPLAEGARPLAAASSWLHRAPGTL